MSRDAESGEMGWPDNPLFADVDPNDKAVLLDCSPRWSMRWLTLDLVMCCVVLDALPDKLCCTQAMGPATPVERVFIQQRALRELAREAAQRATEVG